MSIQPTKISHLGICVSDWDRSLRFYTEVLGFEIDHFAVQDIDAPFEKLVEFEEMKWRGVILARQGFIIELMHYEIPACIGDGERRPMNKLGITHFSFHVDDIDAMIDRIVEYGGKVHPQTRMSGKHGQFVFCTDPDGIRLELWQKPAA